MKKMEYVLVELTRLHDLCSKNGWEEIRRAIAKAEDVIIKELREEETN